MPVMQSELRDGIRLQAGEVRLALRPDLGGCVAGLWWGQVPVLLSDEPAALQSSRPSGCYPLVPYSNRLGFARFRWHGEEHRTRPNFGNSPHSVHGVGWQRPWTVLASDATSAQLVLVHAPDEHWPFAFEARQHFRLSATGLRMEMSVLNTDLRRAPVGLGWHPYFVKRQRSRLHAELTHRWESDPATELPTRRVEQPGVDGDVAHMAFDHAFDGWRGAARIRDERLSLKLTSSESHLVIYTPSSKPYFCVEPVSHVSNAIHMAEPLAHGLRDLEPGQRLDGWLQLDLASA